MKRYDATKDEMVDVTQEWIDEIQGAINIFALRNRIIKKLSEFNVLHNSEMIKIIAGQLGV